MPKMAVDKTGLKPMKRPNGSWLFCAVACAMTGEFLAIAPDRAAAKDFFHKSRKSITKLVRAQVPDGPEIWDDENAQIASDSEDVSLVAMGDDEIFDRDLSASAQFIAPNCTDVFGPHHGPMTDSATNHPASETPLPPADSNSTLSNPDSVFSPNQQQGQMPAPVTSLAAGQGSSSAMSYVPAFMGDFFGGGGTTVTGTSTDSQLGIGGKVSIPTSSSVGILKLAENTSPLPRDRVFLSYNYFSNVNLIPGGIGVNRLTPGIEKTFFSGKTSVEVRVPMALTLGPNTTLNSTGLPAYNTNQYELGNVTTYFKALLYRDEQFALSGGLGVGAPTANGTKIFSNTGAVIDEIHNDAWHLMPFIGSVYTPNDRFYVQTMLQLDFATNGNSVFASSATSGGSGGVGSLEKAGSLDDPAALFASLSTGYWFYQSTDPSARLTRMSLISELHFNTTLQPTDVVVGQLETIGTHQSQIQTVNGVIGTNIVLGQDKSLLLGYVTPLGSSDQAFAGEFRVLFNWYFGASQNRATRVQF